MVLIRQDRVLVNLLASLQVILVFFFFFFTFPKKWVGRAMGNETFYGDGLSAGSPSEFGSDEIW